MGEKLELRLKSPVGAEPAVYPWPLPVYVSVLAGRPGVGVAGLRGSGPAAVLGRSWPAPAAAVAPTRPVPLSRPPARRPRPRALRA